MIELKKSPLGILQSEWEINEIVKLCNEKKVKTVLEIGSLYGGSLWCWKEGIPTMKKLVSVDYMLPELDARYQGVKEAKEKWAEVLKDVESFVAFTGDSKSQAIIDKVKAEFPDGIDFLFIDGGHSYGAVKADLENYISFVNPNGLVAFHDTEREISIYWDEVKRGRRFVELCEDNNRGMGIGVIYPLKTL